MNSFPPPKIIWQILAALFFTFCLVNCGSQQLIFQNPTLNSNNSKIYSDESNKINFSDKENKPGAVITSYGRYKTGKVKEIKKISTTSGGVVLSSDSEELIETTNIIPCRIGETWGFSFEIRNLPLNTPVQYRSEMHHPPIRQPDGTFLSKSITTAIIESTGVISISEKWSFLEGYEYELVTGKWTRKIYIDDQELLSVSFDVIESTIDR